MKIIPRCPRVSLAKWLRIKFILLIKKTPHLYKN